MDARRPLTFKHVRRQVETLQIAERFFDSILLFALFQLDVFRHLAEGPRPLGELARQVGGSEEKLRAVLDASVAVGILQGDAQGYLAGPGLLECLAQEDSPAYLGEWMPFFQAIVPPLARLDEAVRTGVPTASLDAADGGDTLPAITMTRAMDSYARSRGAEFAAKFDFTADRTLLDVGCGPGTYSLSCLPGNPDLTATLLDLPGPIEVARTQVLERGLADRVHLVAGDARTHEAEQAFDVVLVSNMLHMVGPNDSPALLKRCLGFLKPGGRLLVQAEYLDEGRTSPRWPALLSLILQIGTKDGRNHDLTETTGWLRQAGFADIEHVKLSPLNVNSVLVAHRPRVP